MKRNSMTMNACMLAIFISAIALGVATPAEGKMRIVTTIPDLASIASAVAGEHAEVSSIVSGCEDPHFIQAKPGFITMARKADLWIRAGMDLEIGWEDPILDGARNSRIREGAPGHLDASADVAKIDVPATKVTRAMGDVHPQGNPHFWLDPLNGRIVAGTISERLAVLDPAHADDYRQNALAFQRELDRKMFGRDLMEKTGGERLWNLLTTGELDPYLAKTGEKGLDGWLSIMRPHRGKEVVTYHRSWEYLAKRFDLKVAAELEPKPGIPPSPSHMREVVTIMKERGIGVILVEPFYGIKAAETVAVGTGARVLVLPNSVGCAKDPTSYLDLLDLVIRTLGGAL